MIDHADVLTPFISGQGIIIKQRQKAEDAVERCAYFVRNVIQKRRFKPVAFFRMLFGASLFFGGWGNRSLWGGGGSGWGFGGGGGGGGFGGFGGGGGGVGGGGAGGSWEKYKLPAVSF